MAFVPQLDDEYFARPRSKPRTRGQLAKDRGERLQEMAGWAVFVFLVGCAVLGFLLLIGAVVYAGG